MPVDPWGVGRHGSAGIVLGEQRPFPCERRTVSTVGFLPAFVFSAGFARGRGAAGGNRAVRPGEQRPLPFVSDGPFRDSILLSGVPQRRIVLGVRWRTLTSGAAGLATHRQGFGRD